MVSNFRSQVSQQIHLSSFRWSPFLLIIFFSWSPWIGLQFYWQDAYFCALIHPAHRKYLFHGQWLHYQFKVLLFSPPKALRVFTKCLAVIMAQLGRERPPHVFLLWQLADLRSLIAAGHQGYLHSSTVIFQSRPQDQLRQVFSHSYSSIDFLGAMLHFQLAGMYLQRFFLWCITSVHALSLI